MKSFVPTFALVAMAFSALAAATPLPATAQSSVLWTMPGNTGAPPVIAREAMILQVLPETGACMIHPLSPSAPCPRVRLPDGSVRDVQIDGFHRAGPLSIEVDRLTYDWSQQTASHPYTPAFEYTGEVAYEIWIREEWGPCDNDACAIPEPAPLHPAYAIPVPKRSRVISSRSN
ncbi:hypothetical protein A8B78_19640 [Jannaschia sp. EhC01]|nr:hypothetical protein A8B78_19640 [Jannaschia sp. EhC01]